MAKIAVKVPAWISNFLLPEIRKIVKEEIANEVKVLDARISSLDSKIEERTKTLDSKIESLRNEMNTRFDSLEKRIPLIEKIAIIEARLERLEKGSK